MAKNYPAAGLELHMYSAMHAGAQQGTPGPMVPLPTLPKVITAAGRPPQLASPQGPPAPAQAPLPVLVSVPAAVTPPPVVPPAAPMTQARPVAAPRAPAPSPLVPAASPLVPVASPLVPVPSPLVPSAATVPLVSPAPLPITPAPFRGVPAPLISVPVAAVPILTVSPAGQHIGFVGKLTLGFGQCYIKLLGLHHVPCILMKGVAGSSTEFCRSAVLGVPLQQCAGVQELCRRRTFFRNQQWQGAQCHRP